MFKNRWNNLKIIYGERGELALAESGLLTENDHRWILWDLEI